MAQSDMPTMRSKRLGNELRRLRIASDLKVSQVAELLECGQPKISQIENGKRGIRQIDLTLLLDRYGVTDETYRRSLKQLARDIHKVDWWSAQGPLIHDALRDYLTLESDSGVVRLYEPTLIPGILQTESYMRELFTARMPAEQIETLVQTRLKRKELIGGSVDFTLRVIVDELAFHRLMSSRAHRTEQLQHLTELSCRPNVNVQVLPLKAKFQIDQFGPFSLFTFRGESSIDVVWLEHLTGGTLLEQQRDVHAYTRAWEELTAAALPPSDSRQFIGALIKENDS